MGRERARGARGARGACGACGAVISFVSFLILSCNDIRRVRTSDFATFATGTFDLRSRHGLRSGESSPQGPPGLRPRSARTARRAKSEIQRVSVAFDDFATFLKEKQDEIITELEQMEGDAKFSLDPWGCFLTDEDENRSGGLTRVLQGGEVIEKGACSFTLIRGGVLSAERAKTISARQADVLVQAGDAYAAAALSMVLHSKSPMIPTFRSDVRVFWVQSANGQEKAWFGGGADLTPYYLDEKDIGSFHQMYSELCSKHLQHPSFSYASMKQACDDYFFLPARQEHRGTGGIFFDDLPVDDETLTFVKGVVTTWMPSWLPIVARHRAESFSEQQKQWQLLRRGRYLEFNLLYDRGVKFGLANANPRVEGVMVSAPPMIAFEYNHKVEENSAEAALLKVLKEPKDWA